MRVLMWAAVAIAATACSSDLGDIRDPLGDNPDPVNYGDAAMPIDPPADDGDPSIEIATAEAVEDGQVQVTGTSADDRAVTAVELMVGASGPYPAAPVGAGFGQWTATVPAPDAGPALVTATAFDAGGRSASAEVMVPGSDPDDATPPTIELLEPADGLETNVGRLFVRGTTRDETAVVSVAVAMLVDGDEQPLGMARTGDHFDRWALEAPVPPATEVVYIARATDLAGNVSEARATVVSRAAPPHPAPVLESSVPADGSVLDNPFVTLRLQVAGEAPIEEVLVGLAGGPLAAARPDGGAYVFDLRLNPGDNAIRVLMRDADALIGREVIALQLDDGWPDGPSIELDAPSEPGGEVVLDLDKQGVIDMFPVDVQRDTVLLELDAGPLVRNALGIIRSSCGEGWSGPHFAPSAGEPNCVDPPPPGPFLLECPDSWGHPERNLWGLLTMTPANVNVLGSALGCVADRAEPFLATPFGAILGDALQIGPEEVMLSDEPLVAAILDHLIASHPNATPEGALPVTLEDGLLDMAPLREKFGPVGDHPGFIAGNISAAVLTDDFRMGLKLDSNLQLYDGLDLVASSKAYFADRPPQLPVVELAFLTIEEFQLVGIAEAPEVAMDFQMVESDAEIGLGNALDPEPRGNGEVWSLDPWLLERVVAEASVNAFGDLRTGCDRCSGLGDGAGLYLDPQNGTDLAEVTIGRTGYDCDPDLPCSNGGGANPQGITEHMSSLDRFGCLANQECTDRFGPDSFCHPQGVCVDLNDVECLRNQMCGDRELCLGGMCLPADDVECVSDAACANPEVCHEGRCREVPAGWFRLWMPPGVTSLPEPSYIWDVVLDVAQARMRDFGVAEGEGDALFQLEGVPVGLNAEQIEGFVRENLQAQRVTLAQSLLGAYTDLERPVDVYLDTIDGETWLMISPCRVGIAFPANLPAGQNSPPCDAPAETGLYEAVPPARPNTPLGARLDIASPTGRNGIPLVDLAVGQTVLHRAADGTVRRLDVEAVDETSLKVWLRQAYAPPARPEEDM